jgi:hypothetical protein
LPVTFSLVISCNGLLVATALFSCFQLAVVVTS